MHLCEKKAANDKENQVPVTNISKSLPPKKPIQPRDYKSEYRNLSRRFRHLQTQQKNLEADISKFKLADTANKCAAKLSAMCCEVSERATHRSSPHGPCKPSA
jgi:hypothetical protein